MYETSIQTDAQRRTNYKCLDNLELLESMLIPCGCCIETICIRVLGRASRQGGIAYLYCSLQCIEHSFGEPSIPISFPVVVSTRSANPLHARPHVKHTLSLLRNAPYSTRNVQNAKLRFFFRAYF